MGECTNAIPRPENEWIDEVNYRRPDVGDGLDYPVGWHIFPHKKDALHWFDGALGDVVMKVRYRKAHVAGIQRFCGQDLQVIVAKEIKILPDASK